MELSKEVIETAGLSEDQVKAVSGFVETQLIPEIKKTYDDDYSNTANTNAEKIIDGAVNLVKEKTGIERQQGEKLADYNIRAFNEFASEKVKALEAKAGEYDTKINNFKGDDALSQGFSDLQSKYDQLQAKEAEFDKIIGSGVKDANDTLSKENSQLKELLAFGTSKPNFPETVNKYEADTKWNAFKKGILEENTIEVVDGVTLAISKENKHKQSTLDDLVAKDSVLQELLKGRQQTGMDSKPTSMSKIEGVPFDVPVGADSVVRTKLIREHLAKENVAFTSPEYPAKFKELNAKILSGKKAA